MTDTTLKLRTSSSALTTSTTHATAEGTVSKPALVPALSTFRQKKPTGLMSLPTELHIAVTQHLAYPDALALKHTSCHFYGLVQTGIKLKVAWLVHRRQLYLPCPCESGCDLRSDSGFCTASVSTLIHRRRQHVECESRPDLGCIVLDTPVCRRRPGLLQRWWHKLRTKVVIEAWLLSLVLVPLVCSWVWIVELIGASNGDRNST